MDGTRFDQLVRELVDGASRRHLLQRLSALPALGGLASLMDEADAQQGKDKGKKDNDKNDGDDDVAADKKKGKRRKKQCKKKKAKACDGRCGTVTVKCKKGNGKTKKTQVDCGSCACDPPCGACFICDEASETCVVDPEQQGDPCGATGQVCRADGVCACDDDTCPACATCQGDGACSEPCNGAGCCDNGTCQPGTSDTACGTGGEACVACTGGEVCTGGVCAAPACDVCATGCEFSTIQEAIDTMPAGSTITVCAGTYGENLTIDDDVTIVGAGQGNNPANNTILQGNGTTSVVTVSAGTVLLQQLRITGGDASDGGGVHNVAGDLTLDQCTVADNRAQGGYGGGIYNETGATLSLTNCTVTGNDNDNGYSPGVANLGTMTADQCTFNENGLNSLPDPWGGAIYGEGGSTTVTNSTLNANRAQTGGGIMVYNGSATLTGCDISDNVMFDSNPAGGGIFADGDSIWDVTNCTITGNTGAQLGGGVYAYGVMTFTNCQISGNDTDGEGGGIFIDGRFSSVPTVTLDNTDVTGNTAGTTGGGVYVIGSNGTVVCENGSAITSNIPDQCVEADGGNGCETCPA